MQIHHTLNSVARQNTYYVENDSHLIVIDPGSDWSRIQSKIDQIGKPISAILLTHTHYDHILSLEKVRQTYQFPPVFVAASEADWLFTPEFNLSGLDRHSDMEDVICQPAEQTFQYESEYSIDGFHFNVLPTPGHSIGGVSIVFSEAAAVMTGDALFYQTIGRTDLPTGNHEELIQAIKNNLLTLPNHYTVYPGHGPLTTIAHEKQCNPFL